MGGSPFKGLSLFLCGAISLPSEANPAFQGKNRAPLPGRPDKLFQNERPLVSAERMDAEVTMSDLAEVLRNALSLDVHDRAALAERLLASLEELNEEEAERLWAEESQRRLEEYRAGRAKAVPAEEVHEKAERLVR